MFLLALTAFLLSALGLAAFAVATGNKAAIGAADREGMPEQSHTNHPAHLREARLANDASSPAARPAVCPASESDDLETDNTPAGARMSTTLNSADTHGLPTSASPHSMRGLALGVSHDWAGQLRTPCLGKAHGLDLASCTASPRPRIECGEADRRRVKRTTQLALL